MKARLCRSYFFNSFMTSCFKRENNLRADDALILHLSSPMIKQLKLSKRDKIMKKIVGLEKIDKSASAGAAFHTQPVPEHIQRIPGGFDLLKSRVIVLVI